MHRNYYLSLFLVISLLISCSGQPSQDIVVTQQPSPAPDVHSSPTLRNTDIPQTPTSLSTSALQSPPTQTATAINLENLPPLSKVVLSSSDIENLNEYDPVPMVLSTNEATNELQTACLWECVKYRYSLAWGTLTVLLLRAGDPQKAERTVESLRGDFLKTVGFEYTVEYLPHMPMGSWAMVDAASNTTDYRTGAAGFAYGSIVILVTYSQLFCEYTVEVGRYCEGDLMPLAWDSVDFLNAQIRKLEAAGLSK